MKLLVQCEFNEIINDFVVGIAWIAERGRGHGPVGTNDLRLRRGIDSEDKPGRLDMTVWQIDRCCIGFIECQLKGGNIRPFERRCFRMNTLLVEGDMGLLAI